MKKAISFIINLACGCFCAFAAGLWIGEAFEVLFVEEKD